MIKREELEEMIKEEVYLTTHTPEIFGPDGQLVFCILKLHSGFEVYGTSGTISPRDHFDLDKGKEVAKGKALDDLWGKVAFMRQTQEYLRNKAAQISAHLLTNPHTPDESL